VQESIRTGSHKTFNENVKKIVEDFDNLKFAKWKSPKWDLWVRFWLNSILRQTTTLLIL